MQEILAPLDIGIVSQQELGFDVDAEETGDTFVKNALIKARAVAMVCDYPILADDSGICVEALGGALVGQKGKSKEAGGSDQDGKRHHNHVQSLVARALLRLCILSSHFFDIRCAALFFCFPSLFPRFHLRSFLQTESRGQ